MSDEITWKKKDVISRAQELAESELSGDSRYTNVKLWDDGDFMVEVIHGHGEYREKIVWRSSESCFYPAETFMYIVDTIDCTNEGTIVEMEGL